MTDIQHRPKLLDLGHFWLQCKFSKSQSIGGWVHIRDITAGKHTQTKCALSTREVHAITPASCLSLIHTPPRFILFFSFNAFHAFHSLSPTHPPSLSLSLFLSHSILGWKNDIFCSIPCRTDKVEIDSSWCRNHNPASISRISLSRVTCAHHWRTKQISGSYGD